MNDTTVQRIAEALERIAAALEASNQPREKRKFDVSEDEVDRYLKALRENADQLQGKMTIREIAFAADLDVRKGKYQALSRALERFGASKGRTGAGRFYTFPLVPD